MKKTLLTGLLLATTSLCPAQDPEKPAGVPPKPEPLPAAGVAPASAPEPPRKSRSSANANNFKSEISIRNDDGNRIQARAMAGDLLVNGRGLSGRTLVIRSSETDPKVAENLEEDLNVMARILEKAAEPHGDGPVRMVLGIPVFSTGLPKAPRNLYIEGHGAVLMLNVNFSLLPPDKAADTPSKDQGNSEWEEAKGELYGRSTPPREPSWDGGRVKFEEYDAQRVQELKDNVLKALRNASHIRNLKNDDAITVVITGGPVNPNMRNTVVRKGGGGASGAGGGIGGNSYRVEVKESNMRWGADDDTTMTIKVKKSDVDAFSKGSISQEEFTKRAKLAVY
jgi:hypothetical protein